MVNDEFLKQYHNAHGIFLSYGIFDHSPTKVGIQKGYIKKNNAFRFSNFTAGKGDFIDTMQNVWKQDVHRCHMYRLIKKVKNLKKTFEGFELDPFDSKAKSIVAQTLNEYIEASKDELILLQQKAKIQWLKEGDKNTTFYHNMIKARRNKSRVESIKDENGKFYEGSNVVEQFVMHFKKFLGEFVTVKSIEDSLFINKINDDNDVVKMFEEVSNEEIKNAIFDIDSNKAFGPDGFSFEFFKKAWGDWKRGLSKIVNINQSAFIPGRHIQDNILIAQELLRGYNRKNWPKRCAMQIDIQKAYDTVDWTFLESTLVKFGFPKKMVKWIMACISSSSFSICLNGEIHGFFKGGRGLR
ncbi:RNA-directed DNA polymerase, eukaryota, reverse transcriptase zinc-binding domain protein [Tanacetum coccineum]